MFLYIVDDISYFHEVKPETNSSNETPPSIQRAKILTMAAWRVGAVVGMEGLNVTTCNDYSYCEADFPKTNNSQPTSSIPKETWWLDVHQISFPFVKSCFEEKKQKKTTCLSGFPPLTGFRWCLVKANANFRFRLGVWIHQNLEKWSIQVRFQLEIPERLERWKIAPGIY